MEILKTIETIIELCVTVCGCIFALWIFLRDKRRETIIRLVNQVIAYNCLEQEYLDVLSNKKDMPKQNIQVGMRKRAEKNPKNIGSTYPDMTPSTARKILF